jgi:hypothetical protein
LFNRSPTAGNITAIWKDVGIDSDTTAMLVKDLWAHKLLGIQSGSITAMVDSHDVVALRLKPVSTESVVSERG